MNAMSSVSKTDSLTLEQESKLLAAVRRGDEAASEELVRQHAGRMLAVARRMLREEADAADAVQDAFVSALRNLDSFEGQSRIGTWLHRITVNTCLMKLRTARSRPTRSIESLLPTFDDTEHHVNRITDWRQLPQDEIATTELRLQVRTAIGELPEPYRVVLILRDIEGLDTAETAERLGITQAAAKVRLHRARLALRTLLDPFMSN